MLSGLMNIGQSALNASQAWISVTGNNLANADTEGYSRQYVDQKDAGGLTYRPLPVKPVKRSLLLNT